ncbi:MAG: serine/threonine-protein kinase, partial [Terracidiphilus sp.]
MSLEIGNRVGDYEVLSLLGAGGMGRVYKVRNIISNREEAMKILLPDFASERDLAARFMAEIRTLAGLEHPNIAQLRTAFQFQNQFVMVMEYVEGTSLEKLGTETRLSVDQVLDYSTQVLAALSYAHGRSVTHRDIKPANIMITSHGIVKLMDFGIAKSANDMQLTRPGTTMGSVYYMSPEQVRGGTVDARSDIYSFGVTLYEMLTGRKPFQAETSYSVLNAQLNEAPTPPVQVNPALPAELNNIVLRAMVKAPEGRFQSAEEFRNALKALRGPHAVEQAAQPVQPAPQ